ncbi:MAG: hypothetical protein ABWY12_09715 [Burkholderiales bacterium]
MRGLALAVKRMQEGGAVTDAEISPEEAETQRVAEEAIAALEGQSPRPREALNEYIETFGRSTLEELRAEIAAMPRAAGNMVRGPGRGMQDRIPGRVGAQPLLLSDGEFVLPADVVSMLGDGSSLAGERVLHAMMDRVREAKTGTAKQASPLDLRKVLPR